MPSITASNMRQTYSAAIRFRRIDAKSGMNFELFQNGGGSGYGVPDGKGPVIISTRNSSGHGVFGANYANETKRTHVDIGYVAIGAWHTYTIKAVGSHDPSQGRLEFYRDGQLKGTITGRDVNLGPTSNRLPPLKLGMYGDYATGVIDMDNV
jgi:hypothetical protein